MNKNIIIPIVTGIAGLLIGYIIHVAYRHSPGNFVEAHDEHKEGEIWTCSMDPQVRKDGPGDCPICGMDLIPMKVNSNGNPLVFEMSEDAVRIANIQTTVVHGSNGSNGSLIISGKMKADETSSSSVVTHVSGRIERLYVSFTGESVYKGQRVARMYSPDLITAQRELLEAKKIEDLNPRLLEAAKNKLRYWKISDKTIDKILKDEKIQEYFDIRSQHSGVILRKMVSVGDYLGQGGALFELQNLNKLWAVFDVYENDLSSVSVGDLITFTTPSLPNKEFNSTVTFIDPIINSSTRTAGVRMEILNGNKELKPDMFISGSLQTKKTAGSTLQVPRSAVLWTGERSVVYVKLKNMSVPSFEFREITLGKSSGSMYEVLDGLSAGEEVVTNGAFVIDASAQLNNQASMMNRRLVSNNVETKTQMASVNFNTSTPDKFKKQLDKVISSYISLKNALTKSNTVKAATYAKLLIKALGNADKTLVKGDAHLYWMRKSKELRKASEKIEKNKSIKDQRVHFETLSISIIQTVQAFGTYQSKFYIQHCPMAFDDKGANWLSERHNIINPYFGSKMLKCGTNLDSIQSIR